MKKILFSRYSALIFILIIAAFLRLYNITQLPPGLYPDEAMNGNNALEALSAAPPAGGLKIFYPENNGREGLFINIQAISLAIFGNQPWALRIVSAIFGILTVLGIYFLTKELFKNAKISFSPKPAQASRHGVPSEARDERAEAQASPPRWGGRSGLRENEILALFSSFLLATSFWHINFSRIGFRAIMAPFFIIWALYFLLKALNSEKYKMSSIFSGLFLGLGFYSYIAFRAMPLLIIIVWILYWIKNRDSAFRKKILYVACLVSLVALIVFAPLGIYFLKNPADFFGRTTQVSIFSSATPIDDLGLNILKTAGMFNFSGDWNWRHNFAGAPQLFWPVGVLFLMGIFWGVGIFLAKIFPRPNVLPSFPEKYPQSFIILFSWLIIAALPVVISNEGIPHALRSIILIPPAIILAATGGIWFYNWIKGVVINHNTSRTKILNIFIFIFLLILAFQAYYAYFIKWGKNPNIQGAFATDYVAIGRELNSLPKELPKYVVVQASGVNVRGIPMPSQTVMFITDTFTPEKQKGKNIFYVLPSQINQIPLNSNITILK